jgi:hypothetical protein
MRLQDEMIEDIGRGVDRLHIQVTPHPTPKFKLLDR